MRFACTVFAYRSKLLHAHTRTNPRSSTAKAADREGETLFQHEKRTNRGWFFFHGGEGGIRTLAGAFAPLSI
jgi:hypothetical protein